MKTAAIIINKWKLDIFERHLKEANRKWVVSPGATVATLLLKVEYEWVADLAPIVEAANYECRRVGKPK